jgi:uncharacterized protein (TIGR03066 family)
MRAILGCGLVVVLAITAGVSADDKPEQVDGKKLVGKWAPAELPKGAKGFIEMTKDGKFISSFEFGGKAEKASGTYTLEGTTLIVNLARDGKDEKHVLTVTKLSDTELVTQDAKGMVETLKRLVDKK